MSRVIFLNTQTAPRDESSKYKYDRCIQLSLQVYDDGKFNRRASMVSLFNPGEPLSSQAKAYHPQYNDEKLKSQPAIEDSLPKIKLLLDSADKFVMHCSHFHKQVILNELNSAGYTFEFDQKNVFDLMFKIPAYFGKDNFKGKGKKTLEALYEQFVGSMPSTRSGVFNADKKTTKLEGLFDAAINRLIETGDYDTLKHDGKITKDDEALFRTVGVLSTLTPETAHHADLPTKQAKRAEAIQDKPKVTSSELLASHGTFAVPNRRITRSMSKHSENTVDATVVTPK